MGDGGMEAGWVVGLNVLIMRPYVTGQLAGAQVVQHGQRLCHVGHRLVDLLQVSLVLHLHGRANPVSKTSMIIIIIITNG